MIARRLEDTLKGGYGGLYGEVVTTDCYRLCQVKFQPDVVFDIGANIGVFARHARTVFPRAKIFSIEPNPDNCFYFRKFTHDPFINLKECALGVGDIYHGLTARNGSGETYLSAGLGYPKAQMDEAVEVKAGIERSKVSSLTLPEIVRPHWNPSMKAVLKMDCEGAENTVWVDKEAMAIFRQIDYIAMEVHFYALTGGEHPKVVEATQRALKSLEQTHDCELDGVHFWATKKEL